MLILLSVSRPLRISNLEIDTVEYHTTFTYCIIQFNKKKSVLSKDPFKSIPRNIRSKNIQKNLTFSSNPLLFIRKIKHF